MAISYFARGDIDRATASEFQAAVYDVIDTATDTTVVVDFTAVEFLDGVAFAALERCRSYAIARNHALVVSSLRAPYVLMLRLLHWDDLVDPLRTDARSRESRTAPRSASEMQR